MTARSLTPPADQSHIFFHTDQYQPGDPVILGGYVLEGSGGRPGRNYRLLLDCRELLRPGYGEPETVVEVTGRARINVGGHLRVETGDYVRFPVILRPLKSFKNPGSDGSEKYWAAQGIWVGAFVKSPALVSSWPGQGSYPALYRWRARAVDFIEKQVPAPASGILAAQLVGKRNSVDPESEETFRDLGLSHLLAVSGLHLGVCYGFCFGILFFIFKKVLPGRHRLRAKLLAAGTALVPALFYAALVGAASPVVRAAVMVAAVVLALLAVKRGDPWNILAFAAWVLLLAEPYRLFTASFQLSFVATAAMLAVFTPRPGALKKEPGRPRSLWLTPVNQDLGMRIYRRLTNKGEDGPEKDCGPDYFRPSYFRQSLLAALAGTLGTAPLVVWHFGRLPLAGIWANLLFTAIVSISVLMPGLAAMVLLPLSPELAAGPLALAGGILGGLLPLLAALAEWAGPGLMMPAPGFWLTGAWFLAGWIWLRSPRGWRVRLPLAGLVLLSGFLPGLVQGQGTKDVLRFTVLDVGQGSAVHINFPDGRQMLVDGGGSYGFDPGEALIIPYLLRQGVSRLDVVVLTHPDQDHLKGLLKVSQDFRPEEVWDAPWPKNISPMYRSFLDVNFSRRQELGPLQAGRDFGPARASVLWPPPDYQWPLENPGGNWVNDHGLVLRVQWGEFSFLITGDIGPQTEKALVELYGAELGADVLLAPHHGSRGSLTPEFMACVRPGWVVFSAGRNNSFGLPHPESLTRALDYGAVVRRTDLEGAVIFEIKKKRGSLSLTGP